ncbi:MAG TPA: hypothetical protein VFZ53_14620 [Polyangiaceae bacterium]
MIVTAGRFDHLRPRNDTRRRHSSTRRLSTITGGKTQNERNERHWTEHDESRASIVPPRQPSISRADRSRTDREPFCPTGISEIGTYVARMRWRCIESFLLLAALGCDSSARSSSPRARHVPTQHAAASGAVQFDVEALREEAERLAEHLERIRQLRFVGMDEGPVPPFVLAAVDGTEFDSAELVGHRPFVVAFFATWCEACGRKFRRLSSALGETEPMLVIPISVDGPETRHRIEAYLRGVELSAPAVLASDYPFFTLSYNAFDTVPLLVIVGRNGGLVDYQLGNEPEHEARLVASLRLAHVIGPLARPELRAPSSDDEL